MANTVSNVSVGKPKIGGAIWTAPAGSALPTSAVSELGEGYVCLGYVSDDGLTNNNTASTNDIKAWGGDTVLTVQTEKPDEFSFTLIEVLDINVLKAVYGADNVTGTLTAGITVRANSAQAEAAVWVFDMLLTNGAIKRVVVPNGVIKEIGEISYKDEEAIGYSVTLAALPGGSSFDNDTHKEYIIRSATT